MREREEQLATRGFGNEDDQARRGGRPGGLSPRLGGDGGRAGRAAWPQAEASWRKVKDRFPEEAKLRSRSKDDVLAKARWGWVAEKRLADLNGGQSELASCGRRSRTTGGTTCRSRSTRDARGAGHPRACGWRISATTTKAGAVWNIAGRSDREATPTGASGTCSPLSKSPGLRPRPSPTNAEAAAGSSSSRRKLTEASRDRSRRSGDGDPDANAEADGVSASLCREVVDLYDDESTDTIKDVVGQAAANSPPRSRSADRPRSRACPIAVRSAAAFDRASTVIPGGVNSPARAFGAVGGKPLFIARGEGPYLFDLDGNRYLDFIGSWGPLILGHCHPRGRRGGDRGGPQRVELRRADASSRRELAELIVEASRRSRWSASCRAAPRRR